MASHRLTRGEREVLAECELDAAEAEHAWGLATPTEDELDAMAGEHDLCEERCSTCGDVMGEFNWYGQCEECVTQEEEEAGENDDDTRETW